MDEEIPFTHDEIKRLKKMAREDESWEWLWALIRKFSLLVFVLVTSFVTFRESLIKGFKWFVGG